MTYQFSMKFNIYINFTFFTFFFVQKLTKDVLVLNVSPPQLYSYFKYIIRNTKNKRNNFSKIKKKKRIYFLDAN